eukprot:Clim_evm17s39 gene=Clim_evmTU17s39
MEDTYMIFVSKVLSEKGITDDAIVEYIGKMFLEEGDDLDPDEAADIVQGYAEDEIDGLQTVVEKLQCQIRTLKTQEESKTKALRDQELEERFAQQMAIAQEEKEARDAELARQAEKANAMDSKERRQREALMGAYMEGEVVEEEDEHGNISLVYNQKSDSGGNLNSIGPNLNAARVKAAEVHQRMAQKAEHDKKVLRDKETLEAQKRKEEKEKRRTQKKEKRRM